MQDNQKTLKKSYSFEGKGLHSGLKVNMTISPAPINTGIKFLRTDISPDSYISAVVDYVTHTQRGTTLEKGEIRISTLEHILSAFWGLGVDNAIIAIDNYEVPILDGSAKPYTDAIMQDGLLIQDAKRHYYNVKEKIYFKDEKSGSELTILPDDHFSVDLTIDYNSKVLGLQSAHFDLNTDFVKEIAPCRTFVFFHELEFLLKNNLIKGGDLENAIVIVEHDVPTDELNRMATLFNVERVERVPEGYLDNVKLHFQNECARHKLLDVLGDFALIGNRINGRVIASKSGHQINTKVAKLIRSELLNEKQ